MKNQTKSIAENWKMNLIEKLGGYEKAKQKYSERPFDLAWADIGQALLEYRREHNIFEVGDKIAEKYKFKVSMITDLLRDCSDQDMTLKAITTVVERVGE